MTGLDVVQEAIEVARAHSQADNQLRDTGRVEYRCETIESFAARMERSSTAPTVQRSSTSAPPYSSSIGSLAQFDAVVASEVVEHVADVQRFLDCCVRVLRPGGPLLLTTLNRTFLSFVQAIVVAEYILNLLPRGTHRWSKFLQPDELRQILEPRMFSICNEFSWCLIRGFRATK